FLARKVSVVDILGQISFQKLIEPTLICRHRTVRVGELRFQVPGRVEPFGGFACRKVVKRARQCKQITAWLWLTDNLLRGRIPFSKDPGLGGHAGFIRTPKVPRGTEIDQLDRAPVL